MQLEIELVPRIAWYSNLRKKVSKSTWDRIRKKCYSDYNHKCGICGEKGRLNCHEIWDYDDDKHIQKLRGFIALCDLCHWIKHIGLAGIHASEGKLDMSKLIAHFCRVNDISEAEFKEHRNEAFRVWRDRSKHKWKTNLSKWDKFIKK